MLLRKHPRNRDFQWPSGQFRSGHLSAAQVRHYDEEGYVLLPGVFAPQRMSDLAAVIDPFESAAEDDLRAMGGTHKISKADAITFTTYLVTRAPQIRDFSLDPIFRGICDDLLGDRARLYHDQSVYKKPGNPEEFPWHQDNGYTFTEPQAGVTCWLPLTHATVENGCPWIVPRAHRQGTLAHVRTPLGQACDVAGLAAVPVEAKVGDVVLFSRVTPHRTGPNLTRETRKAYILQYALDGAVAYRDGDAPILQDDPDRQYLIS